MQKGTIIGIDLDSRSSIVRSAITKELQEFKKGLKIDKNDPEDEVLTRKQASEFLQICLTTLWDLDRKGILPSRRIKSKVYYLKSDLINFLNQAA